MPRNRATVEPLRIFIGYDSKEPIAYHVLASSILRRASIPVSLIPLTRFLVPYLSDYQGTSLFLDCDMLLRVDILDLWFEVLAQPGKAVWCCQHDYIPKALVKFDGHEQTKYPRKNWSSFMVFDNQKCAALTPEYINAASGLQLHRFQWLKTDEEIGSLPLEWNWLVGEYPANPAAKNLHFTNGTPCFDGFRQCDHAEEWWREYQRALNPTMSAYDRYEQVGDVVLPPGVPV